MNFRLSLAVLLLLNLSRLTGGQKLVSGDCKCRLGVSKRIVGGGEMAPHSVPWQVSLAMNGNHICGYLLKKNRNSFMIGDRRAVSCVVEIRSNPINLIRTIALPEQGHNLEPQRDHDRRSLVTITNFRFSVLSEI